MSNNFKFVQAQAFVLGGAGVVLGDTTVDLSSFKGIDGSLLTMFDFGTKGFATLEPNNSTQEEQISFTGVTQNANGTATLTGVSNVLFISPYTESSGFAKTHAGGVKLVITNTSGFYNTFANRLDDETITGTWTFTQPNYPRMDNVAVFPTDPEQLVPKAYADSLTFAGAPNASTSVQGLVQQATQAEVDAKTLLGSTGAPLFQPLDTQRSTLAVDYVADTGAADAYAIAPSPVISAYVAGQTFTFKAVNANTGASTLAVNGLATKAIKRVDGTALEPGDILASQICVVVYDGTNFQFINPASAVVTPSGSVMMSVASAAPTGWLLCDGTSYLRATYAGLFAVIGTTYGSADGTHFNVPDLRGRVPVGVGTGTGGGASGTGLPTGGSALTAVARASWKGEETHTLTLTESPSHTHTFPGTLGSPGGTNSTASVSAGGNVATTSSAGSDGAHNNIQPVMGINFIIKT